MQASKWTEYAKNQQLLRIKGRRATFVEALENLFYSRSYSRMTDKQRQAAIKSTENKYYEAASEEFLFQAYPQIFEAITNRQEFIGGGQ